MTPLRAQLHLINFSACMVAIALGGGVGMWILRLNAIEQMVGVLLCSSLLAIGFLIHFLKVRPMASDMVWKNERELPRAIAAMRLFPVRASKLSWYLWIGMDVIGSLFFYVYFGSWEQGDQHAIVSLLLAFALLAGGGIAFLLQFYGYKRALYKPLREAADKADSHGITSGMFETPAYGLRNKLVVSSLTLLAGALFFTSVFGYTRLAEGLQERLLVRAERVMERLTPTIERQLESGGDRQIADTLRSTILGAGGRLLVLDDEGNDILQLAANRSEADELVKPWPANWRADRISVSRPLLSGRYSLVGYYPWSLTQGSISFAGKSFFLLFLAVTFLTAAVGVFSAREIARPVKEIVHRAEQIARGDLSEPLEILAEDEVGEFSADLEQVRRYLRGMLKDLEDASVRIERLASKALIASQAIANGSDDQLSRITAGLASIDRLARGFDELSKHSVALSNEAAEGGSSIHELDATVREVDGSTDRMVEKVVSIRDGVDKIYRVADLIFSNLGDLSSSMDVTVRNIRKFSDSVRRNEERVGTARAVSTRMFESSREGLELTEQSVGSIASIENSSEGISGTLEQLIRRLNDVGNLLGVINEVADDTKLLSLNAAIIAAQAGSEGRSFSVLAENIKTLADRTNDATGQIIVMIEDVGDHSLRLADHMERVQASVGLTRDAAGNACAQLNEIIACARKGFDQMAMVASASNRHVEEGQSVERSVVFLASGVESIHASVRSQRMRAAEVASSMERVDSGVRTLKTSSRAQAEGGRLLSGSIEQVVTMVSHLKQILIEQQSEVHRIREVIQTIQSGAVANQKTGRRLHDDVEQLRHASERFRGFVERFRI